MEVRDLNQPAFALQPLYTTVQTRRPATMTQPGDGENKHPQPGNKESMDSSYNMMVEREHSTKDPGEKASASPLQTEAQSLTPAKLPWYQFDGVGIAKGYNLVSSRYRNCIEFTGCSALTSHGLLQLLLRL